MTDFDAALAAGLRHTKDGGIGTLRERTLHAVLKYYMDPDETHHEVPLCGLVADVFDGTAVTEIQTANFSALGKKLPRLLAEYPVTVVYPIAKTKRLIWIDPETGEASAPRRSPKTGRFSDVLPRLYYIRRYLTDDALTVCPALLDIDEWRRRDGWGNDGKRGSHREERIPAGPPELLTLKSRRDYAALIPDTLAGPFSAKELSKALRLSQAEGSRALYTLRAVGAVEQIGKRKNAFLYVRSDTR